MRKLEGGELRNREKRRESIKKITLVYDPLKGKRKGDKQSLVLFLYSDITNIHGAYINKHVVCNFLCTCINYFLKICSNVYITLHFVEIFFWPCINLQFYFF